jgi:protein gp37
MMADWVRAIQRQCQDSKVHFFFKQWGGKRKHETGRELDGRTYDAMPILTDTR